MFLISGSIADRGVSILRPLSCRLVIGLLIVLTFLSVYHILLQRSYGKSHNCTRMYAAVPKRISHTVHAS